MSPQTKHGLIAFAKPIVAQCIICILKSKSEKRIEMLLARSKIERVEKVV